MDTWPEIYNSRYFRLQRKLLMCVGLWPYHAKRKFFSAFWLLLIVFLCGPQVNALKMHFHDPGKLMEHTLMLTVQFAIFMKLFTIVISDEKIKLLYDCISDDWAIITDPQEKQILIEHSEWGRFLGIAYLSMQTPVFLAFSFLPLVPVVLNVIDPQPVPRAKISILHGEYGFDDPDAYYAFTWFWEVLQVFCVLATAGPNDVMYSSSVEHCLAIHAVVRHRLVKLKSTVDNAYSEMRDESERQMIEIVKLHQTILKLTETLESGYSLCFFIMMIIHLVIIPLICVLVIRNLDSTVNLFRYGMFFICALVHLFNIFWPGQKLINHSDEILDAAANNEWYNCSKETKNILRLYMLRCLQPTLLTAGGLMLLNFENYTVIVKTAASYITVFASFQ